MNLFQKYKSLTESAENFKKWFGKSVLHDQGKPHTYYHGTGDDIKAFSHEHIGKGTDAHGSGFYFTNKPETANHYASTKDDKHPNVIPVHLNVSKPIHHDSEEPFKKEHIHKLITSAPNHKESLENHGDVSHEGYHKVLSAAVNSYSSLPKAHAIGALHNDFYHNHAPELLKNVTKITGHDGIIVKNGDHHIVNVFHPNQIKSAIGNKGTYSKKSDDITENLFSKYAALSESVGHDKPHDVPRVKSMVDSGRYDVTPVHSETSKDVEFRTIAKRPANAKEFSTRTGTDTKGWHDPEISRVVTPNKDDKFPRHHTELKHDSGYTQDIPEKRKPGIIYRGMSHEEYHSIKKTGHIKSKGDFNMGGQEGLTYYSKDPASAQFYAHSFAPTEHKASGHHHAYVVGVKDPGTDVRVNGVGEHEVGIPHAISHKDIVSVHQGRAFASVPGSEQARHENGKYVGGSGTTPETHVGWKKIV